MSDTPLPFRRIEVASGEEAQIDFGTGAPIIDEDGRGRRTHVLGVVLMETASPESTRYSLNCIQVQAAPAKVRVVGKRMRLPSFPFPVVDP